MAESYILDEDHCIEIYLRHRDNCKCPWCKKAQSLIRIGSWQGIG